MSSVTGRPIATVPGGVDPASGPIIGAFSRGCGVADMRRLVSRDADTDGVFARLVTRFSPPNIILAPREYAQRDIEGFEVSGA